MRNSRRRDAEGTSDERHERGWSGAEGWRGGERYIDRGTRWETVSAG